jgi:hypothetical protein
MAGGYRTVVLRLLAEYFATLKISFPCRKRHLVVTNLMKAAVDGRWPGTVFETREDGLKA